MSSPDHAAAAPAPGRDVDWEWYRQATEQLEGLDRGALLKAGRRYAMSWAVSAQRAEAVLRSTARGVEEGLRAYRRATALLDVHAKTVRMDDLRVALAVCCEMCGASPDEQMRMWNGSVACLRCAADGEAATVRPELAESQAEAHEAVTG